MRGTLGERLWAKIARPTDEAGCWQWNAATRNGYGVISVNGRIKYAHRVAYELTFGRIPDGLVIDHLCGNRACVRPSHLEAVSQRTNVMRGDTIVRAHAEDRDCGSSGCKNCRRFAA